MFHCIKIFWNSKYFFYRLNEHAKGIELHIGAEKYLYCINELDFLRRSIVYKTIEKSEVKQKENLWKTTRPIRVQFTYWF